MDWAGDSVAVLVGVVESKAINLDGYTVSRIHPMTYPVK